MCWNKSKIYWVFFQHDTSNKNITILKTVTHPTLQDLIACIGNIQTCYSSSRICERVVFYSPVMAVIIEFQADFIGHNNYLENYCSNLKGKCLTDLPVSFPLLLYLSLSQLLCSSFFCLQAVGQAPRWSVSAWNIEDVKTWIFVYRQ